eukprot:365711-Chlamydomonas_euryale.AAC.9
MALKYCDNTHVYLKAALAHRNQPLESEARKSQLKYEKSDIKASASRLYRPAKYAFQHVHAEILHASLASPQQVGNRKLRVAVADQRKKVRRHRRVAQHGKCRGEAPFNMGTR